MSKKFHWDNQTIMDPAEIDACLNCPRPFCTNCFAREPLKGNPKLVLDAAVLSREYNKGESISAMAKALGISKYTLAHRLKTYALPASPPRPQIDRYTFKMLPAHLREKLTWKGEAIV